MNEFKQLIQFTKELQFNVDYKLNQQESTFDQIIKILKKLGKYTKICEIKITKHNS